MATTFNTCALSSSDWASLIASQASLLNIEAIQYLGQTSPWANLLPAGTVEANIGALIKHLVIPRAAIGQSLVAPEFVNKTSACNLQGNTAQWGEFEFSTRLQVLRGESQVICLHDAFHSVLGTYKQVVESLKHGISLVYNADVRNNLMNLSGLKAVILSTDTTVNQALTGGEWQVSAAWRGVLPTSRVTFAWLKALSNEMRYNYDNGLQLFGTGADSYATFVGSAEILDVIRKESGVQNPMYVGIAGSYSEAKNAMWKYLIVDYNFQGIKFAVDPKPFRFNELDNNGAPVGIEPYTETAGDYGYLNATNPDYVNAQYEVAFLLYKDPFKRLVPAKYTGEGDMKFPMQMFGGELRWKAQEDNSCNKWGDFGYFQYQLIRAYQSVIPHGVIPVAYKRCAGDLGLEVCTGVTE